MNKKTIAVFMLVSSVLVSGQLAFAENTSAGQKTVSSIAPPIFFGNSVSIEKNGKVSIQEAKVSSISGSAITATTSWGGFTLVWTVNTDTNTKLNARYGGALNFADIMVGDVISFRGSIVGGSSSGPTVLASAITDLSNQRRNATFTGTVTSVSSSSRSFVLNTQERGVETIYISSSTKFLGQLNNFSYIQVGGKVRASGLWNTEQKTVQASQVMVIKDPRTIERVFEGKIKSVNASGTPASIVATIQGTDRTITLAPDTAVLNFSWQKVSVSSFSVGDSIRVYGIGEDFSISATVVRNTSLK